jgi:hypothetical protein
MRRITVQFTIKNYGNCGGAWIEGSCTLKYVKHKTLIVNDSYYVNLVFIEAFPVVFCLV